MYSQDQIGDFITNGGGPRDESGFGGTGKTVFSSGVDRITHSIQKVKIETTPSCNFCKQVIDVAMSEHKQNCLEYYKEQLSRANEDIEKLKKKLEKASVDGWHVLKIPADGGKVMCPGRRCSSEFVSACTAGTHVLKSHSDQCELKVMYKYNKGKKAAAVEKSDSDSEKD